MPCCGHCEHPPRTSIIVTGILSSPNPAPCSIHIHPAGQSGMGPAYISLLPFQHYKVLARLFWIRGRVSALQNAAQYAVTIITCTYMFCILWHSGTVMLNFRTSRLQPCRNHYVTTTHHAGALAFSSETVILLDWCMALCTTSELHQATSGDGAHSKVVASPNMQGKRRNQPGTV